MASLVEELVQVLEAEQEIYETLIGYGEQKTDILIQGDVAALEKLTGLEQLAGDKLIAQSNKQIQLLKDIASVLGKSKEKMTVTRLIELLDSQPQVQEKLTAARDHVIEAANKMQSLNEQNAVLMRQVKTGLKEGHNIWQTDWEAYI